MSLPADISKTLQDESAKLDSMVENADRKSSLEETIQLYYQVMSLSSMVKMLRQQPNMADPGLLEEISGAEKKIRYFNSSLHPKILSKFAGSIKDTTSRLQTGNPDRLSQKEIEENAILYDKLRQIMSTKEFVQQYDDLL